MHDVIGGGNRPEMSEDNQSRTGDSGGVAIRRGGRAAALRLLGAALGFAAQIVLARTLGLTQYGQFVYAVAIINFSVIIAKFGLDTTQLRFVSVYVAEHSDSRLRGLARFSDTVVAPAGFVVGVVAALVLVWTGGWSTAEQPLGLPLLVAAIPVVALTALRSSSLLGLGKVLRSNAPELLIRPLMLMSGCIVASQYLQTVQAQHGLLIFLLAVITSFLLSTFWLRQDDRMSRSKQVRPEFETRKWLDTSTTFLVSAVAFFAITQADILIVGALLGNDAVAGYTAAARCAIYVQFLLVAVQKAVAPMLSQHYASGDLQSTQRVLDVVASVSSVSGVFAGVVVILFAEPIMGLFGSDFRSAAVLLQILAGAQVLRALTGATNTTMNMTGHHRAALVLQGGFALLGIVLIIVAASFGITFVALATGSVIVAWNIAVCLYLWRATGLISWLRPSSLPTFFDALRHGTLRKSR